MQFTCPNCGGKLEATVKRETYYDITPEGKVIRRDDLGGASIDAVRIYCENDCSLWFNGEAPSDLTEAAIAKLDAWPEAAPSASDPMTHEQFCAWVDANLV